MNNVHSSSGIQQIGDEIESAPDHIHTPQKPALGLVVALCQVLSSEHIAYCHWKSNNALDRSASGENDLDLLISRADIARFSAILGKLGFKEARPELEKQMVGVADYYGFDPDSGRLIHVHAHYQLVLGHDMTKNFRLPIEPAYIASAVQDGLFMVPAPEYEFIVLVIRLILKHATWDVALGKESVLKNAERLELEYLQARLSKTRVDEIIQKQLPYIGVELFWLCLKVLQPGSSVWTRLQTGRQLQLRLQANARHSIASDALLKFIRRWTIKLKRRVFDAPSKHRLNNGGALIAIIGGDGAGKTTLVESLHKWLSRDFDARIFHLGKPRELTLTVVVRAFLRLGNLIGLYPHLNSSNLYIPESKSLLYPGKIPRMIREACKARDRYFTYLQARRFANNGGIVICDRFPISQVKLMDGPAIEQITDDVQTNRISRFLMEFEMKYYRSISLPELVIVLRLNPDIAVQRKTTEDPIQVRVRSTEIWEANWQDSGAFIIDAFQSKDEVLAKAKALIWSQL